MTDLIRRSDALAAIRKEAWPEDGTYPPEDQDIQDAERATVNVCCEAIAALPAVTVGVKPLVFEGRNGFWRADDGIGGFYEVTEVYSAFHMCRIVVGVANKLIPYNSKDAAFGAANVEHQRRILAALEPVAAPDPATIREAALERAANETFGVEREYGQADTFQSGVAAARDRILALIAKGAAE